MEARLRRLEQQQQPGEQTLGFSSGLRRLEQGTRTQRGSSETGASVAARRPAELGSGCDGSTVTKAGREADCPTAGCMDGKRRLRCDELAPGCWRQGEISGEIEWRCGNVGPGAVACPRASLGLLVVCLAAVAGAVLVPTSSAAGTPMTVQVVVENPDYEILAVDPSGMTYGLSVSDDNGIWRSDDHGLDLGPGADAACESARQEHLGAGQRNVAGACRHGGNDGVPLVRPGRRPGRRCWRCSRARRSSTPR